MKPTPFTPKLLPPQTEFLPVKPLKELTNEEALLRHRLELRVERALYKAAVGLQHHNLQPVNSNQSRFSRLWGDEQSIEKALSEAKIALEELRNRRLYCSTHQHFDSYYRDRFGWSVVEILPESH